MPKWLIGVVVITVIGVVIYDYVVSHQRQQDACVSLAVSEAIERHRNDRGEPGEIAMAEGRDARRLSAHCYGLMEEEVRQ